MYFYRPIVPFLLVLKICYTNWEPAVLDRCKSQTVLFVISFVHLTQAFPTFRLYSVECEHQNDPRIRKDGEQTHLDIFKDIIQQSSGIIKETDEKCE